MKLGGGIGNNFSWTSQIVAGQTRYIEVRELNNDYGATTFRIKHIPSSDSVSNFPDELYADYISNGEYTQSNQVINEEIEYAGDVDVYLMVGQGSYHYLDFSSYDQSLYVQLFSTDSLNPYGGWMEWDGNTTDSIRNLHTRFTMTNGKHYYIWVKSLYHEDYEGSYSFEVTTRNKKDIYEDNSNELNATELWGLTSPITDATLHFNDWDTYKFITGTNGSDFTATLNRTSNYGGATGYLYDLVLYTFVVEDGRTKYKEVAYGTASGDINTLSISNLEPAKEYFLEVYYDNLGATYYSSYYPYTLSWTITDNTPTNQILIEEIIPIQQSMTNWDWVACAEMVGKLRLLTEGLPPSTANSYTIANAVLGLLSDIRVDITQTAQAAQFVYTGSVAGLDYVPANVTLYDETGFYDLINDDEAVIIQMGDPSYPGDTTVMRYLVVAGIDTSSHTFYIIDPATGTGSWVAQSLIFNGGYGGSASCYIGHIKELHM